MTPICWSTTNPLGVTPGGWSDNNDGTGNNLLGKTLMNIRLQLGGVGIPGGTYSVTDFTQQF